MMSQFRIPKSFKLLGHTIKVKFNTKYLENKGRIGEADTYLQCIHLAGSYKGDTPPASTIGHTYCHELVHFILDSMGERELCENEKFVDAFGGLLYQILSTSKY